MKLRYDEILYLDQHGDRCPQCGHLTIFHDDDWPCCEVGLCGCGYESNAATRKIRDFEMWPDAPLVELFVEDRL